MNFKVHRRNKSLAVTAPHLDTREGRSLRKVTHHEPLPDALLANAKAVYHAQKDLPQAISLFHQYLQGNPHCSEALYLCGVCQLRVGDTEEALAHLKVVSDSYPGKPNAMLLEAMALNKLGRGQAALAAANECVRRFPRFEEGLCFRGKLLLGMARFQQAEHDFSLLAARSQSSFLSHNALGDCYRAQNRPEKALGSYIRALELLQGAEDSLVREVRLKIGACLYQLERWEDALRILESTPEKNCDCYYYLGSCEVQLNRKEQAILHLEYCLRLEGRPAIMTRAYKHLLQLYLADNQFYEAVQVVQLGRQAGIAPKGWANVVESFMTIIKGHYEEGVSVLNEVWTELKGQEQSKRRSKLRKEASQTKPRYNESQMLMGLGQKGKEGRLRYFSTKSVLRAVPKISSTRVQVSGKEECGPLEEKVEWLYSASEKELMYPLILKFKAYGEFFCNKLFCCLDSYEEYETFIKDVFGRESDVQYNKLLCEGLLMADNEMLEEALAKYNACMQLYQHAHHKLPVEPILYKVCLLVRTAVSQGSHPSAKPISNRSLGPTSVEGESFLSSVVEFMDSYEAVLETSALALYFRSLVLLLLGKLQDSNDCLEHSLKAAEDCSWKWLWAKGVIETRLGNYQEAVKEFSAGLILQNRAELYLGRSIAFLLLSEKGVGCPRPKKEMGGSVGVRKEAVGAKEGASQREQLIENCFQDLQKYIELENDQEQISLWVSKVLFANGAYEEAARSLHKIKEVTSEVKLMREAVAIYSGDFREGGQLGAVIQQAFEGKYVPTSATDPFQKWLIALDLYIREDYPALLKHLQRELFASEEETEQALLRFNVAVVYLLLEDRGKAVNALKGLMGKDDPLELAPTASKLEHLAFDKDECFQELREELGLGSRLLSNYLSYRSVNLTESIRIYVRPSISFPRFDSPCLDLWLDEDWVVAEVCVQAVEKRVEAPWIRRGQNNKVQFTSELEESGWLGESSSLGASKEMVEGGDFAFA